jgi:hypothetical protein
MLKVTRLDSQIANMMKTTNPSNTSMATSMLEARSWADTSSFSGSRGLANAELRGFEGGVARLILPSI